jgi:hypothetical protein
MVDYRLQTAPNKGGSLYITIDDPERDSHVAAFIPVEDLLLKIREIHSLDGFCSTCQLESSKSRCQLLTDEPEQPPKKSNLWLGVAILLIGPFCCSFRSMCLMGTGLLVSPILWARCSSCLALLERVSKPFHQREEHEGCKISVHTVVHLFHLENQGSLSTVLYVA